MNGEPLLTVENLGVDFRVEGAWRPAVSELSFSLGGRETLAIVGESGSGKSVTALAIMRLLPGASSRVRGAIRFNGQTLSSLSDEAMRTLRGDAMTMIFQEPMTSLNPVLTVGFQIGEALVYHRGLTRAAARSEALRLLERVKVPAARQRIAEHPHRFSGGMRQRVMIAMALACKPKLLIADEPTTALDVTVQAEILELIKQLQTEEGMSVVFITHDMGVVAEIADRVVVMCRGEKIEEGNAKKILLSPRETYTKVLLAAVPLPGSMRGESRPKPFDLGDTGENVAPIMPDPSLPLLVVENLVTRFPIRSGLIGRITARVHAVENVSFSIGSGETLALVGESGCGKSTVGRSILRLVEPVGGAVLFEGRDMLALAREPLRAARQRMQMIFQDPFGSLNPRMSVGAAIAEPIIVHGLANARQAVDRVADLLRKVGLTPDMASRLPHEFSGGQRQRIAIARALALGPKLIVADEAVSALDVSVKARVVNLLMRLQAELGLAFLFISHDIAVVERISHRVAVMFLGEIVEIGPRAAILEDARHPYTRELISSVPTPDPSRRTFRRAVETKEAANSLRAVDYRPPRREYREVGPGHWVGEF